jgi:hypothetical protein
MRSFTFWLGRLGEPYVGRWCDLVNSMVASKDSSVTSGEVINALLKNAEPKTRSESIPPPPSDDINVIVPKDPNS